MFFSISLLIAIISNIIVLLANGVLCFLDGPANWTNQLRAIITQCRWVGILYFAFAWFMGDGSVLASGRDTYAQVAHWMLIVSVGWMIVFVLTLVCKIWSKGDKLSSNALILGIVYFVLAYFLH